MYDSNIVYGDTDSTMFQILVELMERFPEKDYKELADEVAKRYGFCRKIEQYNGCEFCKYHINEKDKKGGFICHHHYEPEHSPEECLCWVDRTNESVCKYWGERVAEEVTNRFPEPVLMEYEKGFEIFISIMKKKYAGKYIGQEHLSIHESKLMYKGIVLARRDNCPWTREIYENILKMCMEEQDFLKILRYLYNELKKLYNGEVDYKDLIIVKKMGHNYKKNTSYHMKIFGEEMRRIGKPIESGTRVPYLILEKDDEFAMVEQNDGRTFRKVNKKYLMGLKQVTKQMYEDSLKEVSLKEVSLKDVSLVERSVNSFEEIFSEEIISKEIDKDTLNGEKEIPKVLQSNKYKIDYDYYVDRQLRSHVDQIMGIVYKDLCDHISVAWDYIPTRRHRKARTIHAPVELYHCIRNYGNNLDIVDMLEKEKWIGDFYRGKRYRIVTLDDYFGIKEDE